MVFNNEKITECTFIKAMIIFWQSMRVQCVCVVWGCARPVSTAVDGLFCSFASV